MRRTFIHLSIAAVTFLSGLSASRLWHTTHHVPKIDQHLAVSFCDLVRDPAQYDGKKVRFAAVLYSDSEVPYLYDVSCGSQGTQRLPLVAVPEEANLVVPEWAVEGIGCGNALRSAALTGHVAGLAGNVRVSGIFEANIPAHGSSPSANYPRIVRGSIYGLWQPSERLQDPQ